MSVSGRFWGTAALLLLSATAVRAQSAGGCANLMVIIQSTSSTPATIATDCHHGYFLTASSQTVTSSVPAIVVVEQSFGWGPDCTITVAQGDSSAVLSVQQNKCFAKAGQITASASGSATLLSTDVGSWGSFLPGVAYFLFDPGSGQSAVKAIQHPRVKSPPKPRGKSRR